VIGAQSKHTPVLQPYPWLTKPFDTSLEAIHVGFRGHDPRMLANLAESLAAKMKKSEFETNDEWQSRIEKLRHAPLSSWLTPDSNFAFVIKQAGDYESELQSKYDADKRQLNVWLAANEQRRTVPAYHTEIESFYVGQNAFGVKARVQRIRQTIIELCYKPDFGGVDYGMPGILLQVDASPQEARLMKASLAAVVIFTMEEPYFTESLAQTDATISGPTELSVHRVQVHAALIEVWLYNPTTGQIYRQFDFN
jgi:hypothetical protein